MLKNISKIASVVDVVIIHYDYLLDFSCDEIGIDPETSSG
jgi:hypothetical protein